MAAIPQIHAEISLTVHVIRTTEELLRLGPEWKRLFHRTGCDNVFLSFEWLSEWWLHFGQEHELFVIIVRTQDGQLTALAPFYISLHGGPLRLRELNFLGDRLVGSDYLDFLVDDSCLPSALERIHRCILGNRRLWDYIQLLDVKADSIAATAFNTLMQACGMTPTMTFSSLCPYQKLPRSAEEYNASLTTRFKKNLRYYSRTLQRQGEVEYLTVENAPDIEDAFDDLLRLHRSRFHSRGADSAFLGPQAEAFHRAALRSLTKAGWASIHMLKLNGNCIAASYELLCGRRISFYQSGIDPAYSRFSVGQQLIHFAIESGIEKGYSEFDFLRGNETYKSKWVDDIRNVYTLWFFDRRPKSRMALAVKSLRTLLRSCKAKVLRLKRPADHIHSLFRSHR
jgi:CelD/BcsL family acetyltransferase involved in cellulose biosynthesis